MPTNLVIHWLPLLPAWAVALAASVLFLVLVYGSGILFRKQVPTRWVWRLGLLRLAIVAVFVLLLLRPVASFSRQTEQMPELAILVDDSRSMSLPGAGGRSRLEEVRSTLDGELGSALRGRFRLRWFAFGADARPIEEAESRQLQAGEGTTDYGRSLTSAADLLRAAGASPDRVLLVSDGADRGTEDPAAVARRLGVIVDTLAPGNPAEVAGPEVALVDIQSARRVLLGSETRFQVTLRAAHRRGLDHPTVVRLSEDGKEVGKGEITFLPGMSEARVVLRQRPRTAGNHRYEVRLGDEDRSLAVNVLVSDGKSEVLILEDSWRWEFKYLRRVFEDDPSYRFTGLLARGNGGVVQFGAPDRRARLVGLPRQRADLEEFDVIVLGDVNVRRWPAGLATGLAEAVREGGKSLVVVAGPNVASLAEIPELHALLPVELARESGSPLGGPVAVRVSADGMRSPFAVAEVGKLPPLAQIYAPARKRPGASVLFEAERLRNSYGNLIVMAEHTVGRGRVLYVGTDTLWKWHAWAEPDRGGGTPYNRFWQQALRALTPANPSRPGVSLWLQPDRSAGRVGQALGLRAEIDSDQQLTRPEVRATVTLPSGSRVPLAFSPLPDDPLVLRADFRLPEAGHYDVQAALVVEGRQAAEGSVTLDAAGSDETDGGVDRAGLERLAAATGGQAIDPTRPETWPQQEEPAVR